MHKDFVPGSIGEAHFRLNAILAANVHKRVDGTVASQGTITAKGETLHTCINDLWRIGRKITNPENLSHSHIEGLCRYWHEKSLAVSTRNARLSVLRDFSRWIGKNGMVKSLHEYLPEVDKALLIDKKVATESKSWTENGIDVLEKIILADAIDPKFGLMLRLCLVFGLRRMEVIQFRPHTSDLGKKIRIYVAKNGFSRDIDIQMPEQREVLDQVKNSVGKYDHIGWRINRRGQIATLAYSFSRYDKSMAKIGITREETGGITGHGLRAQFAENMALIARMIPPTLGGTGGQRSKEDLDIIRAQVSALLGHKRISVTASYYGSFGRYVMPDEVDRCKKNIEAALRLCRADLMKPVPVERQGDCKLLLSEMEEIGVDMSMRQAQFFWELHSQRHARHWIAVGTGNAEAIEARANGLVRQLKND